jgi:hypothetical protein
MELPLRNSTSYLNFTALCLILVVLMALHARQGKAAGQKGSLSRAKMVKEYQLTDLCLFTDARYTRNPAMTDWFAPFQDHPMSLEHFPSGSFGSPPPHREAP